MAQQDVFKSKMFVIKRNGQKQEVHFDKITARISKLAYGLNADFCDPVSCSCKPGWPYQFDFSPSCIWTLSIES